MRIKKKLLLGFLLFFSIGTCFQSIANDAFKKNEIELVFSNKPIDFGKIFPIDFFTFGLEYNRNLNDYFSAGLYSGIGFFRYYKYELFENGGHTSSMHSDRSLHYGFNAKLNVLPIIFYTYPKWIDIYFKARVGAFRIPPVAGENIIPTGGHHFDYGLNAGICLKPSRNWGLFYEHDMLAFKLDYILVHRYGLRINF